MKRTNVSVERICRVVTLVENTTQDNTLLCEHGLAFWVEFGSRCVLFDTGQSDLVMINARRLVVPVEKTEAVVLSHGHYDHTGGLKYVLHSAGQAAIYAHPAVFTSKYACDPEQGPRDIGMPGLAKTGLDRLVITDSPREVVPKLWLTGEIPRKTDFEDVGGPYFTDADCEHPDRLLDDQAMFFKASQGLVVILGCAHAGLLNTLQYIRELTNGEPIFYVVGGMHLLNASDERIHLTMEALRKIGVQHFAPAHCTGPNAFHVLESNFPGRCFACPVGKTMDFEIDWQGR